MTRVRHGRARLKVTHILKPSKQLSPHNTVEQSTEDVHIFRTVLWLRSQRKFLVQKDVSFTYLWREYPAFEK